ncbi:hypothetical protein ACFQ1S_11055 [Kibdelosporangium lantanae]|uniref:Uncharacterized protein n=1 Tax=Kibdelosporangium lantanae TaxID=1497396 RepID=A0ABW3M5S9_9PSEU
MVTFYLVKEVRTGSPALPIDEDTPGAVRVLFDQLTLGDTFWPLELFVRKARS